MPFLSHAGDRLRLKHTLQVHAPLPNALGIPGHGAVADQRLQMLSVGMVIVGCKPLKLSLLELVHGKGMNEKE
jgi:hypothetical protein